MRFKEFMQRVGVLVAIPVVVFLGGTVASILVIAIAKATVSTALYLGLLP